jgi:hypothetical protein
MSHFFFEIQPNVIMPSRLYYWRRTIVYVDAGRLARGQKPEGPATGHLDTGFPWFSWVLEQMLRWFPFMFQVAATCFSCSPLPTAKFRANSPYICNMLNDHCHRVSTHLQLIKLLLLLFSPSPKRYCNLTALFWEFTHVYHSSVRKTVPTRLILGDFIIIVIFGERFPLSNFL